MRPSAVVCGSICRKSSALTSKAEGGFRIGKKWNGQVGRNGIPSYRLQASERLYVPARSGATGNPAPAVVASITTGLLPKVTLPWTSRFAGSKKNSAGLPSTRTSRRGFSPGAITTMSVRVGGAFEFQSQSAGGGVPVLEEAFSAPEGKGAGVRRAA